jgi:uncharacterized protein (TIGR04255 family)
MTLELSKADERVAARSSVDMVICQIRFDEQEAVSAGTTAVRFHERLGGPGGRYPKIDQAEGTNRLVVEMGPGGPVQQTTTRKTGWSLEAKDASWSLTLLPDNIGLQTSGGYSGWQDFLRRLTEALEALQEVVSPALEQRLGLRFVDRIAAADLSVDTPADWQPFIAPRFLGPLAEPGIGQAVQIAQQQLVIGGGNDVICSMRHGLALVSGDGRTNYVIDCDLYREGGRPFDVAAILDAVGSFKDQAESLFAVAVTPALLERLSV